MIYEIGVFRISDRLFNKESHIKTFGVQISNLINFSAHNYRYIFWNILESKWEMRIPKNYKNINGARSLKYCYWILINLKVILAMSGGIY